VVVVVVAVVEVVEVVEEVEEAEAVVVVVAVAAVTAVAGFKGVGETKVVGGVGAVFFFPSSSVSTPPRNVLTVHSNNSTGTARKTSLFFLPDPW
jgi:hypothetical protein